MTPRHWLPALLAAGLLAALSTGCGKSSKLTQPKSSTSSSLVNADSVLEVVLNDLLNSPSPSRPSDVNLNPAYQAYQQNLSVDPNRLEAHLGVAILGVLSLAQDTEVNTAFDEWRDYLAANKVPFRAPTPPVAPSPMRPMGIALVPTRISDATRLPFDLVPYSAIAVARPSFIATDPQLSRAQAVLRNLAIPRLTEAITHLDRVAADAAFTFTITARMQGDPLEQPLELDHTDVLALRATCELLLAMCDVAVSYDVDFPGYTDAALVSALSRGSTWMTLRADGAATMGDARLRLLGAVDDVDATIGSLLAETDAQNDDVIKRPSDPQGQQDLQDARTRIQQERPALQGEVTRSEDWDGNGATPDAPLRIDVTRLFTHPVQDWKALLPSYTVAAQKRPLDRMYAFDNGTEQVTIDSLTAGYYSATLYYEVHPGTDTLSWFSGPEVFRAPLTAMARGRILDLAAQPGWSGDGWISYYFYGTLPSGPQVVDFSWYRSWYTSATWVWVPVITWDAATFAAWTWPDPTFDGVLPGQTQSTLYQTFGVDGSGWQRQLVLDWTGQTPGSYAARRLPR